MTERDQDTTVPLHTFSTIALFTEGRSDAILFRRVVPTPPEDAPEGEINQLVVQAQGHMDLSLVMKLGDDDSQQLVYDVTCGEMRHDLSLSPDAKMPPIVVKLSRPGNDEAISEEAYRYEALRSLQGVVLPRCWGLFQANIQDKRVLGLLNRDRENSLDSHWQPDTAVRGVTNMIILEKLGDPVHEGNIPAMSAEDIQLEISRMFKEFYRVGYMPTQCDVRQILSTLGSQEILPSLSSRQGHTFDWKMVDLSLGSHLNRNIPWKSYKDTSDCKELAEEIIYALARRTAKLVVDEAAEAKESEYSEDLRSGEML